MIEADLKNFYVTYGNGSNLASCYSVVQALDEETARNAVFNVTKGHHAFIYDETHWTLYGTKDETQAEKYGLTIVDLQPQQHLAECDD